MLILGIFLSFTLGTLVILQLVAGFNAPGRGRLKRRLAREAGTVGSDSSLLYKDLEALDRSLVEDDRRDPATLEATAASRTVSLQDRFADFARNAGVSFTLRVFVGISLASGAIAAGLGALIGGWVGAAFGFAAGGSVPYFLLDTRRKWRRERMLTQLAGAFDLMARVLKAGQSVPESLRAVVEAFDDPLSGEFANCLHQIEMGLRPDAAFKDLALRSPVLELRTFVIAMAIHRQTGGNLSEILERLSNLVRTRLRVRQKVRSLTAEGRLQSMTLVVLPPLTFGVMYFLNRPYAETLLTQTRLLAATAGFMLIGVLWIRRILSFEG